MLSDTRYKYFFSPRLSSHLDLDYWFMFFKGGGGGDFSHIGIKKVKDYS